jgi:cellulose biosynthesis protein BcsQ
MSATIIAFFNNKGGVGKTSLVYHLAYMYSELGLKVIASDLDPQANLTSAFLDEDLLENIFEDDNHSQTILGSIRPLQKGVGDIAKPHLERINDNLSLLIGDLTLSEFEAELSDQWNKCLNRDERAFRVMSAFWRMMEKANEDFGARIILVDLLPNLGAINRAVLISANYIVIPLAPDLFSLQGLRNLGPTLRQWREQWQERKDKHPNPLELAIPAGEMRPIGYIVMQHPTRLDRPVKAYEKWINRIPSIYRDYVINEDSKKVPLLDRDPYCLAQLKHYRSLMAMSQEARKPIFLLKPADGAIGGHANAIVDAYQDFKNLALEIAKRTGVSLNIS